mgnify:CR=1 FL=1
MKKNTSKASGFSLVEVMIAVLVLGVGILAVSKLQTSLLRSGSDANNRAEASLIAKMKIDDLRRFVSADTYIQIGDDTGGSIISGDFEDTEFSLSWGVENYTYPAELTSPVITSVTTSDFKKVLIDVEWTDVSNTLQHVTLETVIFNYPPFFTALSDDIDNSPRAGAKGLYTPQEAPDVVPIKIDSDGILKETSKPKPEVTREDYATTVEFETVTYVATSNDKFIALRREEFSTVACSCSQRTTNDTNHIYGYTTWDSTEEQFVDFTDKVRNSNNDEEESRVTGTAIVECALCCKDGQYKEIQTNVDDQDQLFANNTDDPSSDAIDKICRLKRIDGTLRVIKPWRLIGFNVIPASYFDDAYTSSATNNISSYSNYVTSLVRSALGVIDEETDADGVVYSINTGFKTYMDSGININRYEDTGHADNDHKIIDISSNRTIQARAIYLDIPPEGIFEGVDGDNRVEKAANVPLDRIPFYEVNVTNLSGWIPDEDNTSFITPPYTDNHDPLVIRGSRIDPACDGISRHCVANQELTSDTFDNDYERGEFYSHDSSTVTVESRIYTSNDGLVDKSINSNTSVDSSIEITGQ